MDFKNFIETANVYFDKLLTEATTKEQKTLIKLIKKAYKKKENVEFINLLVIKLNIFNFSISNTTIQQLNQDNKKRKKVTIN